MRSGSIFRYFNGNEWEWRDKKHFMFSMGVYVETRRVAERKKDMFRIAMLAVNFEIIQWIMNHQDCNRDYDGRTEGIVHLLKIGIIRHFFYCDLSFCCSAFSPLFYSEATKRKFPFNAIKSKCQTFFVCLFGILKNSTESIMNVAWDV